MASLIFDQWTAAAIGLVPTQALTRAAVSACQRTRLAATIAYVRERSPFYRRHFAGCGDDPDALPLTSAADLARDPLHFLCLSRDAVARAVTLPTSGTSGAPKRIFFGAADLAAIVEFFGMGMTTFARPGARVMICLPAAAPGSIGVLLHQALESRGMWGRMYGLIQSPAAALREIEALAIDCLVGVPIQMLALARQPGARRLAGQIANVLLSTDYVPRAVNAALRRVWGCRVIEHYGMTEMGYGVALGCAAHEGYHLREPELFCEVVDPVSGRALPDGQEGELLFSTLTRRVMPLVRYRTGDRAAIDPRPCPCGSVLRRLTKIGGRLSGGLDLGAGAALTPADLDETLLALESVVNYTARVEQSGEQNSLAVTLFTGDSRTASAATAAAAGLAALPSVRSALAAGRLSVPAPAVERGYGPLSGKRVISEIRKG